MVTEKGGIPKENVLTFMFNDIAENPRNPVKGNIINRPNGDRRAPFALAALLETGQNVCAARVLTPPPTAGTNNWPFVKGNIDYSGKDVTPANILAVLSGDKVISSIICM